MDRFANWAITNMSLSGTPCSSLIRPNPRKPLAFFFAICIIYTSFLLFLLCIRHTVDRSHYSHSSHLCPCVTNLGAILLYFTHTLTFEEMKWSHRRKARLEMESLHKKIIYWEERLDLINDVRNISCFLLNGIIWILVFSFHNWGEKHTN